MPQPKPTPVINQSMRQIAASLPPLSRIKIAFDEMLEAKVRASHEGARQAFVEVITISTDDIREAILKTALVLRLAEQGSNPAGAGLYRACINELTGIGANLAMAIAEEEKESPRRHAGQ
jgi:hypothetical protein